MANSTVRITRYIVLKESAAGERYALVGETEATSSTTALRQVVSKISSDSVEGSYVAIPERSFQVVPIAVKHLEPQLLIGGGEQEKAPKLEKQLEPEPEALTPSAPQAVPTKVPRAPKELTGISPIDPENAFDPFEDVIAR